MSSSSPHGMPPSPPKRRTPLIIALACGCSLLLALVLIAVGVGVLLIGSVDDQGPEPTSPVSPSAPETSSSPPEAPPTEIETDQPVDKPTEGPSPETTSPSDATSAITVDRPVRLLRAPGRTASSFLDAPQVED